MESNDPSAQRRRREFVSSGSCEPLASVPNQGSSSLMSLSRFIQLMSQTNIDGPHDQCDVHMGGKHLGSGAQFDVYGHLHVTEPTFPAFDQPYVSDRPKPPPGRKIPVTVAIKRPRFALAVGNDGLSGSSSQSTNSSLEIGFGTPSQLHTLELEVLTLCHSSIRSHRNIVKLLAWGFDFGNIRERGIEPLTPILVLEHGNCSLRTFLAKDKGTIPSQVLQKLALDTAQGLSVLHASGVIHGDLKTDNVLIFPDEEHPFFCIAKLSDFGFSVMEEGRKIFDMGTPGWKAPELPNDDGIDMDMLFKCDYFSLGLLIFSIMLTHGAPPPKGPAGYLTLGLARDSLARSTLLPSAYNRVSGVLEYLLQPNPSDRVSGLENVCLLLEQLDQELFDSHGTWVGGRFNDNTPWSEFPISLYGSTMLIGAHAKFKYLNERLNKEGSILYSWSEIHKFLCELPGEIYDIIAKHYIDGIDSVVSKRTQAEIFSMDIVGQEITGNQLLGLCFSDRLNLGDKIRVARRLRGSCAAVAAAKGYSPAQAVAAQLLEDTSSKLLEVVRSKNQKWQWDAVSTGYLLAWEFAHEHPEEHALALKYFRESGGYNAHYIYARRQGEFSCTPSGLAHHPLEWLSAYPLHHAAVFGIVPEIEDLLERGYGVNSLDASGETPLQRACMAGSSSSVRCLIKHGANPTVKSKVLGSVPLHWLFVFEPKEISDIAILLTTKEKSVLNEPSTENSEAFHFPFRWPVGTPLEWAVLSNRGKAVDVLLGLNSTLGLGSNLDSIIDFFPGPADWSKQIDSGADRGFTEDPNRKLFRTWVYSRAEQYRLPVVQNYPAYQQQLESLTDKRSQWARKPNLHIFNTYGSGLNTAVSENDNSTAKQLINMGSDPNYLIKLKSGDSVTVATALNTAIDEKNPETVQLLLDSGARFDGSDTPDQKNPLRLAVNRRHIGIVKMLLERGADANAQSGEKNQVGTAIFEAAGTGEVAIVKLLLEYGADPAIQSESYGNALEAAAYASAYEIVELFLERGVNPNTPGNTPAGNALQAAAYHGNLRVARALLDKGADPNIQGGDYATAIQAAINPPMHKQWGGRERIVQLLLERGADATISGGKYGSVIQAASSTGDDKLVNLLLDAGAPVNIGGGPDGSALQAAMWTESLSLVQLLLDYGADPDTGGDGKWMTPLQVAVHLEDEKKVELLLRRSADPSIQGGVDGNALRTARKSGNSKILQMLLRWGAEDETELNQWLSILNKRATPPVSHLDLTHARFLLARCFDLKQPTGLPRQLTPANLARKVIDLAEYWPTYLSERHDQVEVFGDTPDIPYLQVKIKGWPSPDTRVHRMIFRIKSRDQEAIKMPGLERSGPYSDSHTWFEVGVRSHDSASLAQSRLTVQRNFCGSLVKRTHHIVLDFNDSDPHISGFVTSLGPGDVVDIFAKSSTSTPTYANYVDSMEVVVFYSHQSGSISRFKVLETSGQNTSWRETGASGTEVVGTSETAPVLMGTGPPKAEIFEALGKEPNRMQTDSTKDEISMAKGTTNPPQSHPIARAFSRCIRFLTGCFK